MSLELVIFYSFSVLVVGASFLVITSRNPVQGALSLIVAFVGSSVLWMLLEAEFLSLALIFVYVGAVMTLFLFVVMMLNIRVEPSKRLFVRYLPLALLISVAILGLMLWVAAPQHFGLAKYAKPFQAGPHYSNTKELGKALYTTYLLPFELSAVILLVAIISAISLALPLIRNRKLQDIDAQIKVKRNERIQLVQMKSEEKDS